MGRHVWVINFGSRASSPFGQTFLKSITTAGSPGSRGDKQKPSLEKSNAPRFIPFSSIEGPYFLGT